MSHGDSALEALCCNVDGDQRAQLLRHLVTAALSKAGGGKTFQHFDECDAVCQNPNATASQMADCIDEADENNQSGDDCDDDDDDGDPSHSHGMFDSHTPADPNPCQSAFGTSCDVLTQHGCTTH